MVRIHKPLMQSKNKCRQNKDERRERTKEASGIDKDPEEKKAIITPLI